MTPSHSLSAMISCPYMHSPFHSHHLREMGAYLDDNMTIASLLGPTVYVPHRVFTLYELANYYDGKNGHPAYVSANGIVFDVTHSKAWSNATHRTLTAGHDYSSLFTIYHCNDLVEMAAHVPIMGHMVYP